MLSALKKKIYLFSVRYGSPLFYAKHINFINSFLYAFYVKIKKTRVIEIKYVSLKFFKIIVTDVSSQMQTKLTLLRAVELDI